MKLEQEVYAAEPKVKKLEQEVYVAEPKVKKIEREVYVAEPKVKKFQQDVWAQYGIDLPGSLHIKSLLFWDGTPFWDFFAA